MPGIDCRSSCEQVCCTLIQIPYLDGTGRNGRLMIAPLLDHWGLLKEPLLYLSLFLERHREEHTGA
jgi:Fic family protein